MPIFEYRCTHCDQVFDILHKGREITADVICPSCGSTEYKKLISAPSVSVGQSSGTDSFSGPSCGADGGCCGGSCQVN